MTPASLRALGDAVCEALGVERAQFRVMCTRNCSGLLDSRAEAEALAASWNRDRLHGDEYSVRPGGALPRVSESDGTAVEVLLPAASRAGIALTLYSPWQVSPLQKHYAIADVGRGRAHRADGESAREVLIRALAKALSISIPGEAP